MTLPGARRFRRRVAGLVTAAMLVPTLTGCVTANPPVLRLDGIVIDAERRASEGEGGWVRVIRAGSTLDGYAGMELQTGDRVETSARAEAVIRYPSGTEVLMRPSSGGRIGSFTDIVGEVFVKVKGIFSADTTFVKAGARGTQYLVREQPGGTTYIVVFEGSVVVESTRNSWAPVTLTPGDATYAYPRAPEPYRASADELRRTQDWVQRLERKVPVQTAISPTGVVVGIGIAAAVAAILSSGGGGSRDGDRRPTPSSIPDRSPAPSTPSTPAVPAGTASPSRGVPSSTGTVPGSYVPPVRTAPGATRSPGPSSSTTRAAPVPAATTPSKVKAAASPVAKPRATRAVIRKPASPASSPSPVIK